MTPKKAFILAAGKGTRLRPYTDTTPKPMVSVAGRSIIMRTLDKLEADGVEEVVVNLHHLKDVLEDHLKTRDTPRLTLSFEEELLETGGGIKKGLHHFGDMPFYIINGDALWTDGPNDSALSRLARHWDPAKMDILLLLQPVSGMTLTAGTGDYNILPDSQCRRSADRTGDHMFAGVRIINPAIFDGTPDGAFSFLQLMDEAEKKHRLYGLRHDGEWYHISTPLDLSAVDAELSGRERPVE